MIDKILLKEIVDGILSGTDKFLVDVSVSTDNDIEIEIDSMAEPISIDDCSMISRKIEDSLDRDKEDFSLTVLSSGVGYPFKDYRQYLKAVDKDVEVRFQDGKKLSGILKSAFQKDGIVNINFEYSKKEKVDGEKRPHVRVHEETIAIVPGIIVKEII